MALPDAVELFWKVEGEFGRLFAVASARKSILFPTKIESDGPVEREAQEAVEADENRLASVEFHAPAGLKAEEARELDRKILALIYSLIREEEVGPAYWLACYAEQEGLENLKGELSRDDYFNGAGVAAARKALGSLERFFREQEEGPPQPPISI